MKGEWDVVQVAGIFLTEMRGALLDEKAVPAFRTKLRALLVPRMAKVGLAPKPREPAARDLAARLARRASRQGSARPGDGVGAGE